MRKAPGVWLCGSAAPVVPLVAAATQVFGVDVWILRLPTVVAALALIPLTAELARTVGGDERAAWMAAIAVAAAPGLLALTSTLGPSAFEPLGWTCARGFLHARL